MRVLRYGVNVLRWVMHVLRYGIGYFRYCATFFRHSEIFSKKISKIFGCTPPARIIITRADNLYACGYLIRLRITYTRADIVLI